MEKIHKGLSKKVVHLVSIITVCLLVIRTLIYRKTVLKITMKQQAELSVEKSGAFLVDTPTCKIPNLDAWDISIRHWVRPARHVTCPSVSSYTYGKDGKLHVNWTAVRNSAEKINLLYCKYQSVFRPVDKYDHNAYLYSTESARFNNSVSISKDDECVRVKCYNSSDHQIYTNFHYFVHLKSSTEDRCKLFSRTTPTNNKTKPNVLIVGIDSISRLNYHRYLKRTRTVLTKLGAFEMLGYNKVADNTFVNVVPLLAGKFAEELPWNEHIRHINFDSFRFIWDEYAKNGYRTLYAEDAPNTAIFDNFKAGFKKNPTDYYNRPFAVAMEENTEIWSSDHMCILEKLETNVILQYVTDYIHVMGCKPHFAFVFLSRMTHDYLEDAGSIDYSLSQFFEHLEKSKLLQNTVIVLFSDHGLRYGDIRRTYQGKLEERLPVLVLKLPKEFQIQHKTHMKALLINRSRLTTPFDIYEFLKDILLPESNAYNRSRRGISLLNEIPENRTCRDAGILPHWCTCSPMIKISTRNPVVQKASTTFIKSISYRLSNVSDLCASLHLSEILSAYMIKPTDQILRFESSNHEVINKTVLYGDAVAPIVDYQITIRTSPGNAIFEGNVRYNEEYALLELTGDISRLNVYKNQSHCLKDPILRKICFCKH